MYAPTYSLDESNSLARMPAKSVMPPRARCASPLSIIHKRSSLPITVDSRRSAHSNVNRCQSWTLIHRHQTGRNGNPAMSDFRTAHARSLHAAVKRPALVAITPWRSSWSETGRAWGVYMKRPITYFFGPGGGGGRFFSFVFNSSFITSTALLSCSSIPAYSLAGSLSTTMSGSTPWPSMIHFLPSRS